MSDSRTNVEIFQLVLGTIIILALMIVKFRMLKRIFIGSGLPKEDLKYYEVKSIYKSLSNNKEPNPRLISKYAKNIEKRVLLLECLSKFNRLDLFPKEYNTLEQLSASYLSNWLNLNDVYDSFPDEIEFCESNDLEDGKRILTYKFKSYEPHILANRNWIFGYVIYGQTEIKVGKKPEFIHSDFSNDKLDSLNIVNKIKNGIQQFV